MTFKYPTPLEQQLLNPHGFDWGDIVLLPDGRKGEVCRPGFKHCQVQLPNGQRVPATFKELRPYQPEGEGMPSQGQLHLFNLSSGVEDDLP